jgi:Flp pilus assembly protein TadG
MRLMYVIRLCRLCACRNNSGQAIVEFTLMLLLFLVIVFAVIDFGAMLYDQTMLSSAATDGARSGAIAGGSSSVAQNTAQNAVNNVIGCSPSVSAATIASTPPQMQVTISCAYSGITPLGSLIGTIMPTLVVQASAKVEQ